VLTSLLGIVGAPLILYGDRQRPRGGRFDAGVVMTRMMFPYIACMSFVALPAAC
jgi:putative peptidoglycan lipid II flippase